MLSFVTSFIAVAMTAMALWRLPALRYDEPQRRALWVCSAGFAAALWCRVPAVKDALNSSPITDLSVLVKYLTSMIAILGVLRYVAAIYSKAQGSEAATPRYILLSRRVGRLAHAGAFGAVAAMIIIFFTVVDRSRPSVDFATDHAGQWGLPPSSPSCTSTLAPLRRRARSSGGVPAFAPKLGSCALGWG